MGESEAAADGRESLARAVHAVYAAPPEEFVATRKEWVGRLRAEGRRDLASQVGGLRKPSAAAAAVNALVRADEPVLGRLRDVGARMRHAQSALDAAAMAALRGDRDAVLADWVAAAREHAPGGSLTAAVEGEVRDTAVAALADAAAAEVVTSGTLTRALSYSGFGEVDVADAVARTSTGVLLTRVEGGRAGDEPDAEPEEAEVRVDLDEAVSDGGPDDEDDADLAQPEPDDEDDDDGDDDAERVASLEMELDEAEKVVAAARAGRKRAAEAAAAADHEVAVAQEQVAQAERLLAGARSHLDRARARRTETAGALESAEEELSASRRQRDAARAALEEAEDG